jgi:hypothetical protein
VGLADLAGIAGDQRALTLFQQGDAAAQAALPGYDTGKWSMYDQNHESDLSYHKLVTGFLKNLCTRTGTAIYCDTATNFTDDLDVAPAVTLASQRIRTGAPAKLTFSLDKISRVGLVVRNSAGTIVYSTSAVVGRRLVQLRQVDRCRAPAVPLHRGGDPPAVTELLHDVGLLSTHGTGLDRLAHGGVAASAAARTLQSGEHWQVTTARSVSGHHH